MWAQSCAGLDKAELYSCRSIPFRMLWVSSYRPFPYLFKRA
jgi:hypothetical protein